MKLAGGDFLIWLIIFVVIALSQGWKQLQQGGETEDDTEPVTPPPPPKPQRPARTATPAWRVDPKKLEQYRRRLEQQSAPPPIVEVVTPVPSEPPPVPLAKPVVRPVRVSSWVEQLRQLGSLRRAIVAAEILGPPKGL